MRELATRARAAVARPIVLIAEDDRNDVRLVSRRRGCAGLDAVSRIGAEVALGLERDFSRWTPRLLLTENLAPAGDRADVGLTLGLRFRP